MAWPVTVCPPLYGQGEQGGASPAGLRGALCWRRGALQPRLRAPLPAGVLRLRVGGQGYPNTSSRPLPLYLYHPPTPSPTSTPTPTPTPHRVPLAVGRRGRARYAGGAAYRRGAAPRTRVRHTRQGSTTSNTSSTTRVVVLVAVHKDSKELAAPIRSCVGRSRPPAFLSTYLVTASMYQSRIGSSSSRCSRRAVGVGRRPQAAITRITPKSRRKRGERSGSPRRLSRS